MKKIVGVLLVLSLSGCGQGPRSSAPTFWTDGVMLEQKKTVVDDQHAKVIMRSASISPVAFSVRRENDPDQRPDQLGLAAKPLAGKAGAWFSGLESALGKRFPQLEMQAEAGRRLQVLGQWERSDNKPAPGYEGRSPMEKVYNAEKNTWEDKAVFIPQVHTFNGCGPVGSTFVPERQKVYLVEFSFPDGGCHQDVYDITRANQRVPVTLIEDFPPSSGKLYSY